MKANKAAALLLSAGLCILPFGPAVSAEVTPDGYNILIAKDGVTKVYQDGRGEWHVYDPASYVVTKNFAYTEDVPEWLKYVHLERNRTLPAMSVDNGRKIYYPYIMIQRDWHVAESKNANSTNQLTYEKKTVGTIQRFDINKFIVPNNAYEVLIYIESGSAAVLEKTLSSVPDMVFKIGVTNGRIVSLKKTVRPEVSADCRIVLDRDYTKGSMGNPVPLETAKDLGLAYTEYELPEDTEGALYVKYSINDLKVAGIGSDGKTVTFTSEGRYADVVIHTCYDINEYSFKFTKGETVSMSVRTDGSVKFVHT